MKKLTTLIFAALIAVTLSMPAWSQSTTGSQQKAAPAKSQKEDKKGKKEAKANKKKADKKDASKKTEKK
jgi:hypothetical protein